MDVKKVEAGIRSTDQIGFLRALFLVFLYLKLTEEIAWSWWWVAAPLWAPWALVAAMLVVVALMKLLLAFYEWRLRRLRRRARTRAGQR